MKQRKRIAAFVLAAAMVFSTLPLNVLAVETPTVAADLCEHHPEHTADCGYTDTLPVETAGLESTYGITADQVTSSASFNATVGTAFPAEIAAAAEKYDPARITRYCIDVASAYHRFYNACRIKGEEAAVLAARLKLADTVRAVIANCLSLIGVAAPEKM